LDHHQPERIVYSSVAEQVGLAAAAVEGSTWTAVGERSLTVDKHKGKGETEAVPLKPAGHAGSLAPAAVMTRVERRRRPSALASAQEASLTGGGAA